MDSIAKQRLDFLPIAAKQQEKEQEEADKDNWEVVEHAVGFPECIEKTEGNRG
jgi:hypothetical protein